MDRKLILPKNLHSLREQNNMTLNDVFNSTQITPIKLSTYENGDKNPSLEEVVALGNFYNVSIDYLLFGN